MTNESNQYFSSTLEKGLIILNLFDRDHTSRRLSEISKITGINKTSVYRFVNTLVKLGYLRKSENNRLLRLGPSAFILGHNFFHGFDVLQNVKPIIEKTFLEHQISIDSAMLYGNKLISLFRREVPNLIYLRLPLVMEDLHARAMGKAVLAYMPADELAEFLRTNELRKLTNNTITSTKEFTKDLELTKERGYSINNEEYRTGLISLGATIVNFNTDDAVGAVSLDFPASEFTLDKVEIRYTGVLTKLASELSEILTHAEL